MTEPIEVGPHRVQRESSNVAAIYFGSSPEESDMDRIMSYLVEIQHGKPTCVLIDFTHVQTLSAGVRRVIGERSQQLDVVAIGMFGASFHLRVIAKLVNGAIAMFKKDAVAQDFFTDRESALEWLEQRLEARKGGAA